jgi:glycosyltransferase involved in cell wall biosynthesis
MDQLSKWDLVASTRPDEMISISTSVKKRIQKYYNRDASVIFPPVDTRRFADSPALRSTDLPTQADLPTHWDSEYYLVVSRLVSYKNVDVVVRAFNNLPDRKLVIIGTGCEQKRLKDLAKSNTTFIDSVEDKELIGYYASCRGLIQANVEDFGLAMVEAQALGKPAIARRGGGALDIIVHGQTGVLYDGKGAGALTTALKQFEAMSFDSKVIQKNASRFDTHIWRSQIKERVQALCQTQK